MLFNIRKGFNILLTIVFVGLTSVATFAATGTVNDNGVNIRSSASTSANIVGSANKGQGFTVNSVNGEWCQIAYNGGVAYIHKNYITIQNSYYVKVNCDGLNLRKEASTSAQKIKLLPKGYYLTLIKNCGEWLQVKDDNGDVGFISAEFAVIKNGVKPANNNASGVVASNNSSKGAEVAAFAQKYVGLKYIYGGTSLSSGTDCSGFTSAVYRSFGVNLNRTSRSQMSNGVAVSRAEIQPGDLVLFESGGTVDHVGMYIGNGKYIHNSMNAGKVVISDFSGPYVNNNLAGIRRVIN